ncbi:MAG: hemerythrin domain-containing protein [Acidobacteriota bacterium]
MQRHSALIPLSQQHHNGLALCVMASRSLAEDASPENLVLWCGRAVERFDGELANHFQLEEEILFPAHPGPLAEQLIAEHRELESFVATLRSAPDRSTLDAFLELLRRHIRLEENEFFESAQRSVPAAQLQSIGEEINRRAVQIRL